MRRRYRSLTGLLGGLAFTLNGYLGAWALLSEHTGWGVFLFMLGSLGLVLAGILAVLPFVEKKKPEMPSGLRRLFYRADLFFPGDALGYYFALQLAIRPIQRLQAVKVRVGCEAPVDLHGVDLFLRPSGRGFWDPRQVGSYAFEFEVEEWSTTQVLIVEIRAKAPQGINRIELV